MKLNARAIYAKALIVPITSILMGCSPSCEGIIGVAMTTVKSVVLKGDSAQKDTSQMLPLPIKEGEKPFEWKKGVPVLRGKLRSKEVRGPGQGLQ